MPTKKIDLVDDESLDEDGSFEDDDTIVIDDQPDDDSDDTSDNVGDVSVEINVEALIAEVESEQGNEASRAKEIHRRLEELQERRETAKNIADPYDGDSDED